MREAFPNPVTFQLLLQKYVFENNFCTSFKNCFHVVCIHVENIPSIHGQEMMLVLHDQRFFINFLHVGATFCFFPAISMSSTYTDRNNPCFR